MYRIMIDALNCSCVLFLLYYYLSLDNLEGTAGEGHHCRYMPSQSLLSLLFLLFFKNMSHSDKGCGDSYVVMYNHDTI